MPALSALGFEAYEGDEGNREAWNNYAEVAREAYENLAENLTPKAGSPTVASDIAKRALQSALSTTQNAAGRSAGNGRRRPRGKKRIVHLAPGEYLVVVQRKRR